MWMSKPLEKTDPELMERLEHFMEQEVPGEPGQGLEAKTRYLAPLPPQPCRIFPRISSGSGSPG